MRGQGPCRSDARTSIELYPATSRSILSCYIFLPDPPCSRQKKKKSKLQCVFIVISCTFMQLLFSLRHNVVCLPVEVFTVSKWFPREAGNAAMTTRSLVPPSSDQPWPSSVIPRCLQWRERCRQYPSVVSGQVVPRLRSLG